ncbi:MAG: glycosyl transferase family 2, partial [Nocardioidaceae bacterium]|nr:glycosyl transferase family 2 [Nocardioidaceae bacterium]
LGLERPLVGFLADAGYRQRQLTPPLARAWRSDVRRYGDVLEHGLLDLLHRAPSPAPSWLQGLVVAELAAYVGFTDSQSPTGVPTDGPVADRFHDLVGQVLDRIDRDAAVPHTAIWVREPGRTVLQHGWRDAPWHESPVRLGPFDEERGLVRASWWFTGDAPTEDLRLDGAPLVPTHAKTRDLDYCGRALLHERILWLPMDGAVTLRLDGEPVPFAHHAAETTTFATWPGIVAREVETLLPRLATADPEPAPTSRDARKALKLVQSEKVRRRYRDAWVLMDRIYNTGDSAEVLFRHIRATHPEINAWFVLEEGGPEWERFRREGDGDRLVAHGSLQWRLLMAHAQHLISSHVDEPIVHPPLVQEMNQELAPPRWRYHFLNHGLIKDDLSAWLNDKPIATFVTSSAQEFASIAGDHTPYTFTTHEVVDTGMPRFDRLLQVGNRYPADQRDLVLVAPTWRSGLSSLPAEGASRRELKDGVLETDYTRSWLAFLADPTLAEACREHGVTLAFLPHPNMQPMLPMLDLPEHVTPLEYEGYDVQEFFARSRVMVTDFSSVAFNAAYLERPLVYFQFDEDVVLGGGHMGRRGYFDYRRDGFGPVETTVGDAVAAVVTALEHGAAPAPTYQARIEATFPVRDGSCCERVIAAVRRTTEQERTPVPTPVMPAPVGVTA